MPSELRTAIAQLFVVGIPGPVLDDATRGVLETLRPGGVILFARNVGAPDAVAALTNALHALPSAPLVSIDHEGGRVQRLREPFTVFPAAAVVGRAGTPDAAYRVGRAMGTELRTVGIDLNFAPVLDVHSNPANPVIGDRAFGTDPAHVAEFGVAAIRGLLDGGVVPCGKHFPGHGDTASDSHFELPVATRTRADLERIELPPFRAAVAAGIPLLMSAHVRYPDLDAARPATLSPTILADLLRHQLGFDGAIATDDLEMRAITDQLSVGDAAVGALQAGADMLLVCSDLALAAAAVDTVAEAIRKGHLAVEVVLAAGRRLAALRRLAVALPATPCELPNPDHIDLAAQLAAV